MIFYWTTWSSVKLPTRKVAKSIQLLVHGLNYFKEFHEDRFFVPCCLIFTSMILFSALNDTDICDFADNKKVYKHFAHFIHIWDLKKNLPLPVLGSLTGTPLGFFFGDGTTNSKTLLFSLKLAIWLFKNYFHYIQVYVLRVIQADHVHSFHNALEIFLYKGIEIQPVDYSKFFL